jgi:5-methylcytosine-specific restriction endonuclease McrA
MEKEGLTRMYPIVTSNKIVRKPSFDWVKYSEYLQSPQWFEIRNVVFERDNHQCQNKKCKKETNLVVHHLRYKNKYNEMEHLEDLKTLCRECHEELHAKRKQKSKKKLYRY